jgi:hypothetical protein
VTLDQLYRLHTPFVILFLAFVVVFVASSLRAERRK